MSRTHHPRRPKGAKPSGGMLRSEVATRLTQAVISLADNVKRVDQAAERLYRAHELAREWGMTEDEVIRVFNLACAGRPDRARALERYGKRTEGQS